MKITINIDTENDAFKNDLVEEVRSCFHAFIYDFTRQGKRKGKLYDVNGNTVGTFKVTGR
jgi:hypothetical protein